MNIEDSLSSKKEIKKWKKQRSERGFSDYDIFEINTWFLKIMPEMIGELIKVNNGYPLSFQEEYTKSHNLDPMNISSEDYKKMGEYCLNKWTNILRRMKLAFLEADPSTCSYKNKYNEEYQQRLHEFTKVYGHGGEMLKGNIRTDELKDEKGKVLDAVYSAIKPYRFEDISENNKRISKLYYDEELKIDSYRKKNQKKALEMFVKYFDDFWW